MTVLIKLASFVILVSLWLPSTAGAFGSSYSRPSSAEVCRTRGTAMTGVVQSVDHTTRWITFVQDGGPVRQFVYSSQARFWFGESKVSSAHLKPGMRIHVYLHIPFFGQDYVNQIGLLDPQPKKPQTKATFHD